MKRYLPFVIVGAVALLTAGAGAMLYRAKVHPGAGASSAPAGSTANANEEQLHIRGNPAAPVTLEEFGDFQCPSCGTVSSVIARLEHEYGRRLRVIFRQYPLAMHSHAMEAALAAEAAGLQGHFWEMHDLLYKNQDVWSNVPEVRTIFTGYARSLGLNEERFLKDSNSDEVRSRVFWEGQQGVSRGVQLTPTLFVNGRRLDLPFTEEHLRSEIEAALGGGKGY